jgi:hypothetical protein
LENKLAEIPAKERLRRRMYKMTVMSLLTGRQMLKRDIIYYLADAHPTHPDANIIILSARTDRGARRQAKQVENDLPFAKTPKLFFFRSVDGCWGVIDR